VGEHLAQTLFLVQSALDDRVEEDTVDADVLQEAMHANARVGSHVNLTKLRSPMKKLFYEKKIKMDCLIILNLWRLT